MADMDMNDSIGECPICFVPSTSLTTSTSTDLRSHVEFVYSRTCGHTFCLTCIQKILLAPNATKRTSVMKVLRDDEHVVTTTQGACPMCRAELSYFDLMKVMFYAGEGDENKTAIKSNVSVVPPTNLSGIPFPVSLNGAKFQSESASYIHFPTVQVNDAASGKKVVRVFLSQLDINMKAPLGQDGVMQLSSFKYLAETNTCTGRVKKQLHDLDCIVEYTIWLTFSDNFHFITHGICRIKKTQRLHDNNQANEISDYPQIRTETKTYVYPISGDGDRMRRYLPKLKKLQEIPYNENSYWGNVFCQEMKIGLASYHFVTGPVVYAGKGTPTSPAVDAVAYISYDHELTSLWSPLDNGKPIPSRVQFRNIVCPDKCTFRGSVCWEDDYNTTWNGMSRWEYEMKFDSKFMCVASGSVYSITSDHSGGTKEKMSAFGESLVYINAGIYDATWTKIVLKYSTSMERQTHMPPMQYMSNIMDEIMHETQMEGDRLLLEGVTEKCATLLFDVLKVATHRGCSRLSEIVKRREFPTARVDVGSLDNKNDNNPVDTRYFFE